MKPVFALNLSHEGIVLLHRSPRGAWTEVGDVALDDPNLRENLSFLRSTAVGLEGKGFGTKLIMPSSQVLCREIHAPGPGENERRAQILTALEGETPYEVDDLTFDWTGNGPIVEVAVVWNETLDEAEEFAVEHRFNPISFVGDAREHPDGWEPFFGRTDFSHAFLGADAEVRDTPEPNPSTPPDESLFIAPKQIAPKQAGDAGETALDETPLAETNLTKDPDAAGDENMFAKSPADAGMANIFTDGSETPAATDQTPALDTADENSEPTPAGVFSSHRDHSIAPQEAEDHPASRISPRILITPEAEQPQQQSAASGIIAGERLRNSYLAEETGARRFVLRMANVTPLVMSAILRLGSLGSYLLGKFGRKAPGSNILEPKVDAVVIAGKTGPDRPLKDRKIKRFAIISLGVLAIFALVAGAYSMLGSDGAGTRTRTRTRAVAVAVGDATNVPATRAAARGVRADNRAAPRPGDFESVVAALKSSQSVAPADLPLIRPERRSRFEGDTDPQADLPDTATPVTSLTEQELADVHAAGLEPPTQEELAEYGPDDPANGTARRNIAAAYEATGILQTVRKLPNPLAKPERDDIFVASIDRPLTAGDAIILPDFSSGPRDDPPHKRLSPLGPDVVFNLDDKGLVKPTKTGALNPDGILVIAGKPKVTPPEKPKTDVLVPPNPLAAQTPKARPADLKTGEDAVFVQGRLTLAQLRLKRTRARPVSVQTELAKEGATPSELAVLTSFQPARRPSDFSETVRKTRVKIASATPATAPITDVGPVLPIRASVAKNATIKRGINLSQVSLIGVYGSEAKRRALLRLPSGRFVKVKKGDRLDGGRIAAIGIDSLSYIKGGRNRLLKMPRE